MNRKNHDICNSYTGPRDDIARLVSGDAHRILDIGCSTGNLGKNLKREDRKVIGIEINEYAARQAEEKMDKVIVGDIERLALDEYFDPGYFDCIIFGDVLEHLKDPWSVLKSITKFLNGKGIVIASIPNVRHYSTVASLVLKGYWPYQKRGIHDRTHLRFFCYKNIQQLFEYAGFELFKIERKYKIIESPYSRFSFLNRFSRYLAIPLSLFKDFLTFHYLIVAKPNRKQTNGEQK